MTGQDLISYELNESGFQLEKVLEGITEAQLDRKSCPSAMSPREMIEHLCEAYQAFLTHLAGEKFEWGSYRIEDTSRENLLATLYGAREEAVSTALRSDSEEALKAASAYLVLHDAYHVGQLAMTRLGTDPGWDPYSIYRF